MGHDIYGHRARQIAYLRRSMGSSAIHKFYKALGAERYDNGVSGSGDYMHVDIPTLQTAMEIIAKDDEIDKEDKRDFLKFLSECINETEINKKDEVVLYFG